MQPRRSLFILLIGGVFLLLGACSSTGQLASAGDDVGDQQSEGELSTTETTAVTTTTMAPRPPEIDVPESTFAQVGQSVSEAVVVVDPNNDDTVVRLLSNDASGLLPVTNVRGRIIGFEWQPTEPGEWDVVFSATDTGGLVSEATVRLVARNEPSIDTVFVMGDSIAAGFGRDRSDFVSSDECFRSEMDSYGSVAFERLIEAGALGAEAELIFVACAGIGSGDLGITETEATNGDGDVIGAPATQLERATQLNPTIITLTIGADDIGLFDLDQWLTTGAGQDPTRAADPSEIEMRAAVARSNVADVLDVLVSTTSAHIVVTTLYNPVAANPVGVDGCTADCMVAVTNNIVDAFNEQIVDLMAEQRPGRVSIARLDGDADVFEAPNGAGLDALRDGLGPLQGLVDTFTGGSNALCADDGGVDDPLISRLDCAHPNEDGQRAIGEVVTSELLAI